MFWLWPLITIIFFYFFALLQTSFFIYYNFLGAIPNLVFVLFFVLVFFSPKDSYYRTVFLAVTAGVFLDIFSAHNLGISILLLIIIGVLIKKFQSSLKEKKLGYPLSYFLVLFLVSFLAYSLLIKVGLYFLISEPIIINLSTGFLAELIYNLAFAVLAFIIFKKLFTNEKVDKKNDFL